MEQPSRYKERSETLNPWLAEITALPFVRAATSLQKDSSVGYFRFDAGVRIETPAGAWEYLAEIKRSYLDLSITRAMAGIAKEVLLQGKKLLLLARYIPLPTAQRLVEAGVEFVDLSGNIHIDMAPGYHWTVLGNRERTIAGRPPVQTPATLQVLFAMAASLSPEKWTVRELAAKAGVSKSKAARTRKDCLKDRTIRDLGDSYRISDPQELADQLLSGYRQTLRPKLMIGRFRAQQRALEGFLGQLREATRPGDPKYALSGGAAAYRLQGFYSGPSATVFVQWSTEDLLRRLRLLPDRDGPITLLRGFGEMVFWRTVDAVPLAHPWLIYAELMFEPDPRAHEAAAELRQEYLVP